MKIGLLTFPRLTNTFSENRATLYAQRLEPSVLYLNPTCGESVFVEGNMPRQDIDLYLCSVYTRGWEKFCDERVDSIDEFLNQGYLA